MLCADVVTPESASPTSAQYRRDGLRARAWRGRVFFCIFKKGRSVAKTESNSAFSVFYLFSVRFTACSPPSLEAFLLHKDSRSFGESRPGSKGRGSFDFTEWTKPPCSLRSLLLSLTGRSSIKTATFLRLTRRLTRWPVWTRARRVCLPYGWEGTGSITRLPRLLKPIRLPKVRRQPLYRSLRCLARTIPQFIEVSCSLESLKLKGVFGAVKGAQ